MSITSAETDCSMPSNRHTRYPGLTDKCTNLFRKINEKLNAYIHALRSKSGDKSQQSLVSCFMELRDKLEMLRLQLNEHVEQEKYYAGYFTPDNVINNLEISINNLVENAKILEHKVSTLAEKYRPELTVQKRRISGCEPIDVDYNETPDNLCKVVYAAVLKRKIGEIVVEFYVERNTGLELNFTVIDVMGVLFKTMLVCCKKKPHGLEVYVRCASCTTSIISLKKLGKYGIKSALLHCKWCMRNNHALRVPQKEPPSIYGCIAGGGFCATCNATMHA